MPRRAIFVRPGETFDVALIEPATSGYVWNLVWSEPGLEFVRSEVEPAARRRLGARSVRRFWLRALVIGTSHASFELRRAWESEPVERASFEVNVVEE